MTPDTPLPLDRLARRREHLMTEITTAPSTVHVEPLLRSRRTVRYAVAAAAVVVAAAATSLVITIGGDATGLGPTAFAVTPIPHGNVAIDIVSTQASADEMTRQLQAKGLPIRIATMPATPALVGTWVSVGSTGDVPAAVYEKVGNQTEGYAATLEVPAHFPGTLTLTVGVPPRPDEPINVAGLRNALAPGGPLACQRLSGATPAAARATLRRLGYTIDYWTTGLPVFGSFTPAKIGVVSAPPAGSRVTQAWVHDWIGANWSNVNPGMEKHVVVQVQAPSAPTYPYAIWQGFAPSLRNGAKPGSAGC